MKQLGDRGVVEGGNRPCNANGETNHINTFAWKFHRKEIIYVTLRYVLL
jgi:hypothetical protein